MKKNFSSKNLCGRKRGARARAGLRVWDLGNGTIMDVAKSGLRQNFAKVAKILQLSQKYSKTNSASLKKRRLCAPCGDNKNYPMRISAVIVK